MRDDPAKTTPNSRAWARLPAYLVAYLAFRTGYTKLAAETLAGSADGDRYRRLAERYGGLLQGELDGESPARWSA